MKIFHLADLHLGRQYYNYSMREDQEDAIKQVLSQADLKKPDAVFLCGDIYDRADPPESAVHLYDYLLTELDRRGIWTYIIPGNHDSAERLACGSQLMKESHVFVAPVFHGTPEPILQEDAFGPVRIYLMPFLKPVIVRDAYKDDPAAQELRSYQEAVRYVIEQMHVDPIRRNILLAHQFVTGAKRSDSETETVGGLDNIDAGLFASFDYTALGHIHTAQNIGSPKVRYAGTPLKYSLSEAGDRKSFTVVNLDADGNVKTTECMFKPKRDVRVVRGTYEEIVHNALRETAHKEDYIHAELDDDRPIPDIMSKLRTVYPNITDLKYTNAGISQEEMDDDAVPDAEMAPDKLFEEFFEKKNGRPMTDPQKEYLQSLMKEIWGE